ncbi:hypothetical protein Sjap_017836 [Stephania japonica]|uniref:Uncharacterized protein n=1 Tax=Stephania japonica TaxID=461633 RepID=A0AAP0I6W4_9MAGN
MEGSTVPFYGDAASSSSSGGRSEGHRPPGGRGGGGPPSRVLPFAPTVGGTPLWATPTYEEAAAVMILSSPPLAAHFYAADAHVTAVDTIDPLVSKSSINDKEIKEVSEVVPLLSLNSPLALLLSTWVFKTIGASIF